MANSSPDTSYVKTSSAYSVEIITTEQGIGSLVEDWNRLSDTAKQPNSFMTFDWFRAWNQLRSREQHQGGRRPNVFVLRKDGAVAGISPLIYRETSRLGLVVRKLEFVGREADYNNLVVGDDPAGQSAALAQFFADQKDHWDIIDLRDLSETGNSKAVIESALSETGLIYRILPEEERCPYLPIDAPWSEMVNRFSSASRRTFRKQQSRLARMTAEGLRVRIVENPHEVSGLMQKLIALESQKRVHGKLSQPFIAAYPEVFQSLFDTLGPRGWFFIIILELVDRPVAWQLYFRCGKKLWGFLTAYDHTFSRLSPGTMLVPATIDYGFTHGYDECDFLRGEESYKMRWTTEYHQPYRLLIWNKHWMGRTRAFIYLDLKPKVYKLLGRTG